MQNSPHTSESKDCKRIVLYFTSAGVENWYVLGFMPKESKNSNAEE